MTATRRYASTEPPIERWLASHSTAVALVLVALGLLARLRAADAPFLQPDEALHLRIASAGSLAATYQESLTNAHPPLFYFLLRAWRIAAHSDWALRLLSVAFGTAFLWFAWLWASAALGVACGLTTLACLAFLPSIVLVSSELRAYSLLLGLIAASVWALDRALAEGSPRRMWAFTGLSALALATHYSAFQVLAATFLYAAARLRLERRPRPFVLAWAAGQALLAAEAAFFLATHVARLRGSALEREVQDTWLKESFFHGEESPLGFVAERTLSLFQYVFSTRAGGALGLALFAGGVLWLAARRRPAAILLAVPFVLAAAGGLLAVYPYGGTRHSVDLALFACAGTGVALARLTRERLWVGIAVAAALVAAGFAISP